MEVNPGTWRCVHCEAYERGRVEAAAEIERLRAEVGRLQNRWDNHIARLRHDEERTCLRIDNFEPCGECEACLLRDSELGAQDQLIESDGGDT